MNETEKKIELAKKFFEKAYHLQMREYLDRAETFYQKSIDSYPTTKAHTFLGWVYSLRGQYRTAIDECLKAISIDPAFGNTYNDIGAYLIQLKRYSDAIPWLYKAIHAPKYENYLYPYMNLGLVYEIKGDWYSAMTQYKKVIDDYPDYKPARIALDKLKGKFN
jgi:Tfp pilus assembly protein PilF